MPTQTRINMIKLIHNWNATGEQNKMIEQKPDQFPFCHDQIETLDHMFELSKYDLTPIWNVLHKQLQK